MSAFIAELLLPFTYGYMVKAIWVSALVGGVCAFLSAYLMLKGWSLMGDALGHSIVPGVAVAYILGAPFAIGAFLAGIAASISMNILKRTSRLREDAIIGLVFTTFFATGLLLASIWPTSVSIQTIVLTLLSACTVAALQTVGACLVIAMVVTPGATAYLLTDRFGRLIILSVGLGVFTSAAGAYLSYFLDGATGGVIVTLQTLLFLIAFYFAPKHGVLAARRRTAAEVSA
jgi:manganese/iron transport system permease protein